MAICYRMRSIVFPNKTIDKLNSSARKVIRKTSNFSTYTSNITINSPTKFGGLGLVDLEILQYSTILSSYLIGILNNPNSTANLIIKDRLKDMSENDVPLSIFINPKFQFNEKFTYLKHKFSFAYNLILALKKTNTYILEKNIDINNPRYLFYNDKNMLLWFKKRKITDVSSMFNENNELLSKKELENKLDISISEKKRFYYKDIIPIKRNNLIKINYNNKQNLVPLKKDLNNHNWTINKEGSIEVFTDGSCSNNIESKHAGYGVFFEDNHPLNYSRKLCRNT